MRFAGFTLVELVMVIALAGVVAVMISTVLSRPMESLVAQSQRAVLVDQAATALNRMARDIRLAVPNSVRVDAANTSVEMLNILAAGRYRPNRVGATGLRFAPGNAADCTAAVAAGVGNCSAFQVLDPNLLSVPADLASVRWMVVYNTDVAIWNGAAGGVGVITPDNTGFARAAVAGVNGDANETLLTLAPPGGGSFSFSFASPQRRFYMVDQVVGYRCAGNQLLRYTRAALAPAFAGAGQVLAAGVDCNRTAFTYRAGTTRRAGLLSLTLRLAQGGEAVQLQQQVHVDNAP